MANDLRELLGKAKGILILSAEPSCVEKLVPCIVSDHCVCKEVLWRRVAILAGGKTALLAYIYMGTLGV